MAAIFLPSLGLAWLAVHSVRDQQVVLEHQQAIICQNITDALAKNIQGEMDQVRGDFVQTTQHLLSENSPPQMLARDFNRKLRETWPMAEIGFAVDLDGEIYSPKAYDGPEAKTFRDENDRFLSNRENVVVYSSNSLVPSQNSLTLQNAAPQLTASLRNQAANTTANPALPQAQSTLDSLQLSKNASSLSEPSKDASENAAHKAIGIAGRMAQAPLPADQNAPPAAAAADSVSALSRSEVAAVPPMETTAAPPATDQSKSGAVPRISTAAPAPPATTASLAPPPTSSATLSAETGQTGTISVGNNISIPNTRLAAPSGGAEMLNNNINNSSNNNNADLQFAKIQRNVIPQNASQETASLSSTVPEESDFRRLIGTDTSGGLARFLENKLRLMVWSHATADTPIVFGAQLDQARLVETLKISFQIPELAQGSSSLSSGSDYCAAILDDTGRPVALSRPGFKGDWKHPFVATEIGEALPHWEAALYLVDPQQISRAARTLQLTLGLIVLLLVAAIVSGGSLIAADVRRHVRLAQQKTDFVSNVSHELKTPLTSIRMFADMLAEKRVPEEERRTTYLRIIAAEAARLTRLINNVLDFARLERGARPGEQSPCDLVEAARDVIETCRPHLEVAGVSFQSEIEAETLPIVADRDALAQIILNLISNAEKYGGNDVLVRVRRQEISSGAFGCIDVLDRGPGIPPKQVKTVFEPFHRLDDSLSSGIPGSGLGLTLARRMARAHGGDVTYSPRAGGGSCFTLSVPLAHQSQMK